MGLLKIMVELNFTFESNGGSWNENRNLVSYEKNNWKIQIPKHLI